MFTRIDHVEIVPTDTGWVDEGISLGSGEVVRLNLVNTANTRIFNFGLRGARMKLVGGDSGRCEREVFVDEVMLAPSERAIVDVLFEREGEVRLEHRTPDDTYVLATLTVAGEWTINSLNDTIQILTRSDATTVAYGETNAGIEVWEAVYDWHVKNRQPINTTRLPDGSK